MVTDLLLNSERGDGDVGHVPVQVQIRISSESHIHDQNSDEERERREDERIGGIGRVGQHRIGLPLRVECGRKLAVEFRNRMTANRK